MPRELDARYTHKGVYSAWLTKNKGDGAKAKWIQSACRRYFTIDFDSQIVFYAHSETDKKISLPISFRDIMSASMAPPVGEEIGARGRECTMRRSRSGLSFGLAKQAPLGEFPFVLQTRDRRIRLAADTEANAFSWVEMLKAAHRQAINEETHGEAVPGPVNTNAFEMEGPLIGKRKVSQASSGGTSGGTQSPTIASSKASRSTAEGSESDSLSSPAAWSDSEVCSSETRQTQPISTSAAENSSPNVSPVAVEEPAHRTVAFAPTTSAACSNVDTPAAHSLVQGVSSCPVRPIFQASDFGFDEADESEREPTSLSRDSSTNSITISPRPRQQPPSQSFSDGGGGTHEQCNGQATENSLPAEDVQALDCMDDDSDREDQRFLHAREQRIELDLALTKKHHRKDSGGKSSKEPVETVIEKNRPTHRPSSQHAHPESKQDHHRTPPVEVARDATSVQYGAQFGEEAEGNENNAARIAADLELLRKPGRAHCAVAAAGPAAQKPDINEATDKIEKAKRKAERKAAKEAAKRLSTQDTSKLVAGNEKGAEVHEDKARIMADLALVQQQHRAYPSHTRGTSTGALRRNREAGEQASRA